ncbi:TPA: hypothetical protein I9089_002042 [Clostridium perfringens]|nr:hypothetical protein [Clostridium perfringens]HAT4301951.1 hypothetical protein [Clostridium perfringens]
MYWGIMIKLTIIEIFIIIFFMSRIKKFRSFFETSFKNLKYLNTLFMIILFILVWIVPKEYFDYLIGIFTVLEILFISWYLLFIETKITEAFKILIFLVFMTIGLNIAKNTSLGDSIGLKDIVYFYGLLTIYYLIAHIKKILSLIINRKIYKIKDNIFTNDKENRNDKIKVEFDDIQGFANNFCFKLGYPPKNITLRDYADKLKDTIGNLLIALVIIVLAIIFSIIEFYQYHTYIIDVGYIHWYSMSVSLSMIIIVVIITFFQTKKENEEKFCNINDIWNNLSLNNKYIRILVPVISSVLIISVLCSLNNILIIISILFFILLDILLFKEIYM